MPQEVEQQGYRPVQVIDDQTFREEQLDTSQKKYVVDKFAVSKMLALTVRSVTNLMTRPTFPKPFRLPGGRPSGIWTKSIDTWRPKAPSESVSQRKSS